MKKVKAPEDFPENGGTFERNKIIAQKILDMSVHVRNQGGDNSFFRANSFAKASKVIADASFPIQSGKQVRVLLFKPLQFLDYASTIYF